MRIALILILTSVFYTSSFCQNKVLEYNVGWKGGVNRVKFYSFPGSNAGETVVIIEGEDSLKSLLLNSRMKVTREFSFEHGILQQYSGGFMRNDTLALFTRDFDVMHTYAYDMRNGSLSKTKTGFSYNGEKLITHLSINGRYLYITAYKKEPVLNIYEFNSQGKYELTKYDLGQQALNTGYSKDDLWKALTAPQVVGREVDVAAVQKEVECDVEIAKASNKIYVRNDSLSLLMDKEPGVTRVFTIDLTRKQLSYRVINRDMILPEGDKSYNSFLCENNLYYILGSQEGLQVSANNFYDGREVMMYRANRDEDINFKNTSVQQAGASSFYAAGTYRSLGKTKQFLNKVISGKAVIAASINNYNQCEIAVGAYKEAINGRYPAYEGPTPVHAEVGSTWQRITRFKMLVDPLTLKWLDEPVRMTVFEKAEQYREGLAIPFNGHGFINLNNRFYYAFYDSSKRSFCIVRI